MNSIDKARNRDDLINEILLTLYKNRETVAVLVEGPDDIEFFEKVFKKLENVVYFESLSGCEGLYELLKEPDLDSRRIIAVRDKDYTDPAAPEKYPPRMFAYDDCAMELMILHHPYIQETLRDCYALKQESFPLDMMRHIAPFSLLRQKNARNEWGIAFQEKCDGRGGYPIHAKTKPAPNAKKPVPDIEEVFKLYEKDYPELNGQYEVCQADSKALADDALWDITNGHDICRALGSVSSLSSGSLGEVGYRKLMFFIYRFEDFQSTRLYHALSAYRLSNGRRPFAAI